MELSLPVESVRERDIDFLLVEEFLSSKAFVAFFTRTLNLPNCDRLTKVERSINDFGLGETDVLVEYQSGPLTVGILIENKLDALFQPQQAERYFARAKEHEARKTYDQTHVVLVAPQQYIERQNDFELYLSYQQLMKYFQSSSLGQRGNFKAQLLTIASEKLRRGYVALNSAPNQAFWLRYREQLAIDAPLVAMKQVDIIPAGSDWIDLSFGPHKFVHKLAKGQFDYLNPTNEAKLALDQTFGDRLERLTFKNGEVLRIRTTPMDRLAPFDEQVTHFEEYINNLRVIISAIQTADH